MSANVRLNPKEGIIYGIIKGKVDDHDMMNLIEDSYNIILANDTVLDFIGDFTGVEKYIGDNRSNLHIDIREFLAHPHRGEVFTIGMTPEIAEVTRKAIPGGLKVHVANSVEEARKKIFEEIRPAREKAKK